MTEPVIQALGTVAAAIVSAIVAIAVVFIKSRIDKRQAEKDEHRNVNAQYLSLLRFYLEETFFRLYEIRNRIEREGGQCQDLLYISEARQVSEQEADWFNGYGCYLISTCHITASLFYYIKRLKDERPYLKFDNEDDTILLTFISDVSRAFLKDLGIYYSVQPSIGSDVYLNSEERLLTYREFCQVLQDPQKRIWFDRLIEFYISTGKGKVDRVDLALDSIRRVSSFLDEMVGGGPSIEKRLLAEQTLQQRLTALKEGVAIEEEPEVFVEDVRSIIQQMRERIKQFTEKVTKKKNEK